MHDLWLKDKDHENVLLNNVPVIFAHGHRVGNTWRFANGQSVVETVKAYDKFAEESHLPKLELVIACNPDNNPNPLGIKIKDFPTDRPVVQAVGEVITMRRHSSNITDEGKVSMDIETGEFWGLDDLIVSKQVKIVK